MIRTIIGQIVGSTNVDGQGERYDRTFWQRLLSSMGGRHPLHQHHDMSLPICGQMENFRLTPDPNNAGEWLVVCDVTYDDEKVNLNVDGGGFSWSATMNLRATAPDCDTFVYLPYPYYNDNELLQALLAHGDSIGVGRWIKKGLEPVAIGLIIAGTNLLLGPAWKRVYDDVIHPQLSRLFSHCKNLLWTRGISTDLIQTCMLPYNGRRVALNLVPARGAEEICFSSAIISDAIDLARSCLEKDWHQSRKDVDRVVLIFDVEHGKYRIDRIHYSDGSVVGDGFSAAE